MIPGSANPLLLQSAAEAGEYTISRSVRFNSSDSAYLSRTPSTAGNRKTFTWAGWVKRSKPGERFRLISAGPDNSNRFIFGFGSNDQLEIISIVGSTTRAEIDTNAVYRDPSAWYHIVLKYDATSTSAAVYVNGVSQSLTVIQAVANVDHLVNSTNAHYIARTVDGTLYSNGYLADIHFIDGQALDPTSFTEVDATTGQLIPKQYTGSFGTNGFWLKFSDNSAATATTLGKDYSGNSNNWTPNNLSVTAGAGNDSLVDTPTSYGTDTGAGGEVRGNYCTLNPLFGDSVAIKNGNLDYDGTVDASSTGTRASVAVSSGKWYYEVTLSSPRAFTCGWANASDLSAEPTIRYAIGCRAFNNDYRITVDATAYDPGDTGSADDVIGVAFDADQEKAWFAINGVWKGSTSQDPATDTGGYTGSTMVGPYIPYVSRDSRTHNPVGSLNFGQRPFAYTAPSGFKALCTTNLDAPLVAKPSEVMDVKLYTGNGSTQTISGLGFSPDLVWIKSRNSIYSHNFYDVIRGVNKALFSDVTNAETTYTDRLSSFNSDGFTLGAGLGTNENNITFVTWAWDAGSSTVTNTQGSITSSVRANASAGFSIVTYTGNGTTDLASATIGHGLGVAPSLVITKNRSGAANTWNTYHASIGNTGALLLNSTAATDTNQRFWNNTSPTSTVFSVSTNSTGYTNANGINYVAYCFAPVAGYSSAFSYTGNGSSDGPMVWLGFRPRWILLKRTDTSGDWVLHDTARDAYNVGDKTLYPNLSDAEFTVARLDELSNGFKLRSTSVTTNASGGTYIGFAFAESPFQYARAR